MKRDGNLRIRQDNVRGYITQAGQRVEDCRKSMIYNLDYNGVLSIGNGEVYSTSSGVVSKQFTPSPVIGNISGTWQLTNSTGNILVWSNSAFLNGIAALCLDQESQTILTYFLLAPPSSCTRLIFSTASGR